MEGGVTINAGPRHKPKFLKDWTPTFLPSRRRPIEQTNKIKKQFSYFFSGKYCGDKFPPIITSSGRSLWLRFSSDKTISYTGFKAVYTFIPNPLGNLPDIGKCEFETGGYQGMYGFGQSTITA